MGMLDGKRAVVTGVGPGLGTEVALGLAREGADVALVARSQRVTPDVAAEIRFMGRRAEVVSANIIEPEDVSRMVDEVGEAFEGRVDILVNSAFRSGDFTSFADADLEKWRKITEVNLWGGLSVTQAMLPLLRPAKGRIVFIGSLIDRLSIPFMGALATSKSAVAALADTWRQELAPWGMHVGLVEPGFISTGADEATKARIDRLLADLPDDQAALYGDSFREMTQRGYATQTSGSTPEGVAQVILAMLTDSHPKDHVLTGSKAHVGALVGKLPSTLQDLLKRKAFGLPDPDSR